MLNGVLRGAQGACSERPHAVALPRVGDCPNPHLLFFLLRDCVLGFTAHGRCFVGRNRSLLGVIAALSMTKSIAAHSLLVDIGSFWLLRCKVNAPS